MTVIRSVLVFYLATVICLPAAAQNVVADEGVGLSRQELEFLVKNWTPEMRQAAANNPGDRLELLNMALSNKKIAAQAELISPDTDPDAYWRLALSIRNLQSQYVVNRFIQGLEVPDMTELAAERYQTQKDKYALVPEERYSSHILLLCPPGTCDREPRRLEAAKILAELEAGADFAELAAKYSEDPASKDKGGQFDHWLTLGEARTDPQYVGGVYSIEKVGGHTGIVDTRFGLHIIQLDDIRPAHYKPFDEVKENIVAVLRKEYIDLQAKKFNASFRITDKAYIDGAVVEDLLKPYKTTGQ